MPDGRVLIAWDDGPLVASPTWTRIDDPTGDTFPLQFVSGFDTSNGRQSLIDSTDTGTATVYINDHELGLFDDRNTSSPYQGELSGRQIMCQIYNPVTATWEPQFRGLIDSYTYDIDPALVGRDSSGNPAPLNASIQLDCVDIFDYLAGYLLTPGLDGVLPPPGMEDGVYYAQTAGTGHDRIVEALTDAGIDPDMYIVSSLNVTLQAAKYDSTDSALTVIRDAVDADLPFVANVYVDRFGRLAARGRYSRFDPDTVSAEEGSDWDFERWAVGDGYYVSIDDTRGQMRVLSYVRDRADLINKAICYPAGMAQSNMPNQVYADDSSVAAYGSHAADPMSDLLTLADTTVPEPDPNVTCFNYAKLLVLNKKDPRAAISALQLKTMHPSDARAEATWGVMCGADISHIVNVAAGYPGGTGFTGGSPADDYYIEGRALTVRPMTPDFDYIECDLNVSPAIWSMDTHGVFT